MSLEEELTAVVPDPEPEPTPKPLLSLSTDLEGFGVDVVRATRTWIQYGTVGFAVICIVVGAVEGLFGH